MQPDRRPFSPAAFALLALLLTGVGLSTAACVVGHREVESIDLPADSLTVRSPVKAHLLDGSTIVYPEGVVIVRDTLRGRGTRYDIALADSSPVTLVPLDSLGALESFQFKEDVAATVLLSTLAGAGAAVGAFALAVAIFGSCPTVYSDSAGTAVLEAETFSYSIAPMLEVRDVDRLRVQPDPRGVVQLEVRNEALETHYLNHVELLEIDHERDEFVLPDQGLNPVAVRDLLAPTRIVDRAGQNLRPTLATADGSVFRSERRALEELDVDDMVDYIDMTAPAPVGVDSVAIVFRLRNSLLGAVMLYEVMLGEHGARSLDWLGSDLQHIGRAVQLGRWHAKHMGLRIAVWDGAEFRHVARFRNAGPVAWTDIAAVIPVPQGDSLRVRFSFLADNWRIDKVAIASYVRRPRARWITPSEVQGADGRRDSTALNNLRLADNRYLQTTPGQRFNLLFDVGVAGEGSARTFFLGSQGYYIEWVRRSWIQAARDRRGFTPSDSTILDALIRWRSVRDTFRERFEKDRVPVR